MSLSGKQQAFVREYLKDHNATQAAIRAGYSEKTAYSIGNENLRKPEIMAALDLAIMTAEEAALNLTEIANGNMADLMSITTQGFTLELMIKDPETGEMVVNPKTRLIKKIKQKVTTFIAKKEDDEDREVIETEIELYSRHEANKDILKYRGKLVDRTDVTTNGESIKADDHGGFDRALSALSDAIRETIFRPATKERSPMDAPEQTSMAGPSVEGG